MAYEDSAILMKVALIVMQEHEYMIIDSYTHSK